MQLLWCIQKKTLYRLSCSGWAKTIIKGHVLVYIFLVAYCFIFWCLHIFSDNLFFWNCYININLINTCIGHEKQCPGVEEFKNTSIYIFSYHTVIAGLLGFKPKISYGNLDHHHRGIRIYICFYPDYAWGILWLGMYQMSINDILHISTYIYNSCTKLYFTNIKYITFLVNPCIMELGHWKQYVPNIRYANEWYMNTSNFFF